MEFPVVRMYHAMHDAAETSSSGEIHDIWAEAMSKGGGEAVVRDALSVLWTTTGGFGGPTLAFVDSIATFELTLNSCQSRCIQQMTGFLLKYSPTAGDDPVALARAVHTELSSLKISPLDWEESARVGHIERAELQVLIIDRYDVRAQMESGPQSGKVLADIFRLKNELLDKYIEWFETGSALVVPDIIH